MVKRKAQSVINMKEREEKITEHEQGNLCMGCGERQPNTNKICRSCRERMENESTWPPAPAQIDKILGAVKLKPYLTSMGWLDTILGIFLGLTFHWFVFYGLINNVFYYLLSRNMQIHWGVEFSSGVTLLVSLVAWSRLRLLYRRLANTII